MEDGASIRQTTRRLCRACEPAIIALLALSSFTAQCHGQFECFRVFPDGTRVPCDEFKHPPRPVGFEYLGPIPYVSAEGSPFDLSGLGETFFLEDFEDGLLNTPGIYQPLDPATHGNIISTSSVDSDDGIIDGDGTSGNAIAASMIAYTFDDPPTIWRNIRFEFDRSELGGLPRQIGFVVTDAAGAGIRVRLLDEEFRELDFHSIGSMPHDSQIPGGTSDDRFFGIVANQGIFHIDIEARYRGTSLDDRRRFAIDHLQYGHLTPEPRGAVLLLAAGIPILSVAMFRRRRQSGLRVMEGSSRLHCGSLDRESKDVHKGDEQT
jgi:hypothetical protein